MNGQFSDRSKERSKAILDYFVIFESEITDDDQPRITERIVYAE